MHEVVLTKMSDQFPSDDWVLQMFEGWFDPCPLNSEPIVDGLLIDWPDRTFVNPPYSNPLPWVEKGVREMQRGRRVAFLLKADTSTRWFRLLHEWGGEGVVGEW